MAKGLKGSEKAARDVGDVRSMCNDTYLGSKNFSYLNCFYCLFHNLLLVIEEIKIQNLLKDW